MTTAAKLAAIGVVGIGVALVARMPSQQQVFRSTANAISVDVSVKSGKNPVTNLNASDFMLLDNGVAQQIDVFIADALSIDVSLVLDVSASVVGPMLDRLKTAVRDVAALLRRDDRLRLIALRNELREVFAFQPGGSTPAVEKMTARGGTSLFDAIAIAMMHDRPPERRHLIVAFTDGEDTLSILDQPTARDVARGGDAVLAIVVPAPVRMTPAGSGILIGGVVDPGLLNAGGRTTIIRTLDPPPDLAPLREVTSAAGGQLVMFPAGGSITNTFAQLILDFRTSYVLRYSPTGVKREGWHDITVKVNKSDKYEIRARKGYNGG